ncbi:MAG TPA: hypothetical protein PKW79_01175, partial [Rhabdochlamydiaceae bacterium]|nr:hypothetical protein [Rhabdochlamydiaceae bacterium]
ILLRGEPQGISWIVNYPNFTVVIPDPEVKHDSFGYPVAQGSERFLNYLNQWLVLKQNEHFSKEQYDIWILGMTDSANHQERRWSIIRNVLGWTEN